MMSILYLLRAAKTALTAQTGSRVSPTRNVTYSLTNQSIKSFWMVLAIELVTSHNSGMDAKNLRSSASPLLFSKTLKSASSPSPAVMTERPPSAVSAIFSSPWKKELHHHRSKWILPVEKLTGVRSATNGWKMSRWTTDATPLSTMASAARSLLIATAAQTYRLPSACGDIRRQFDKRCRQGRINKSLAQHSMYVGKVFSGRSLC